LLTAQIIAGAPTGGAELFFERLCIALHTPADPILPIIRHNPPRAARLRAAGLTPGELRFGGPLDLLTRPRLSRLLHAKAPSVAVAWMGRAAAAAPIGPWTLVGRLGGYYDLKRFRRCSHLIGNTRHLAAWMIAQGVPAPSVHYVPNFVPDLQSVPPADRAALGVPPDAPLILALGRLHASKAFDLLIRALALLPHAHAVIAGEGPERHALTRLAAELNLSPRLHLPGWREDTAALLAAADLLVCPSRIEPLGNVILEAWSAARPVIAAAAQGPAALIHDTIDGTLVPLDDPKALAAAITAILSAPAAAAAMAQAGRARYQADFAQPVVVSAWRAVLTKVAP
jgi:glycosyltransferase involved in cell wall biosynthesis